MLLLGLLVLDVTGLVVGKFVFMGWGFWGSGCFLAKSGDPLRHWLLSFFEFDFERLEKNSFSKHITSIM
jgi:hypothetical protein